MSGLRRPIAHPLHTVCLLGLVAFSAYLGAGRTHVFQAGPDLNRVFLYVRTLISEGVLFAVMIAGVRFYGTPISMVVGRRWVLSDLGLGLAFWVVNLLATALAATLLRVGGNGGIAFLMPRSRNEAVMWVLLSLVAAFCEEAIYRGYFQQQFASLTGSVPAGIVSSAVLFGGVHLYQGWRRAAVICFGGVLSGMLVHWRGSVRPVMIAHGLQDALAPALIRLG